MWKDWLWLVDYYPWKDFVVEIGLERRSEFNSVILNTFDWFDKPVEQ